MKNKIINISIVLLCMFIFVLILQFIGLSISEKYETQLEGLKPTLEDLKEAEILKNKIYFQKKVILILFLISSVVFTILFIERKNNF